MPGWRILGPVDGYGPIFDWKRRRAVRRKENWRQLSIFCLIGGSGYVVNVAFFAFCLEGLHFDARIAALIAFLCAVFNNFVWNRRWTFPHRRADARREAIVFFLVSTVAFLLSLAILTVLVDLAYVKPIFAQIMSIGTATPVGFVGNKIWTFRGAVPQSSDLPRLSDGSMVRHRGNV
jgi:putative flippase GtrA